MNNFGSETRLTDSLERKLIAQAIEEQMSFKPGKAIKALFARIATKLSSNAVRTGSEHAVS